MTRFSLFQVVSAYTNTGMSLVDQSMIPFQKAYLMIVFMIFLILAGNTAFVSLSIDLFRTHFPYFFPSRFCTSRKLFYCLYAYPFLCKSLRLLMRVLSSTSLLQLSQNIVFLDGVSARSFARIRGYTRHCSSY